MCIWQVVHGFTWTWGCSRDCPCFVAIPCSVSAWAVDTATCAPWHNMWVPQACWPPLLCPSDAAFERDCGIGKGCANNQENPETRGQVWSEEDLSLVNKDQDRKHGNCTYINPWDLMGCSHGCWGSLLVSLWDCSWLPVTGGGSWGPRERKCHSYLKEEQVDSLANCRLVSFTLIPWKVMQQTILRTIYKHMKDKKGNMSSHCGFRNIKSHLNKLKVFYNEVAASVNKNIAYLDFTRAFDTVTLIIDILLEYGLGKQTVPCPVLWKLSELLDWKGCDQQYEAQLQASH